MPPSTRRPLLKRGSRSPDVVRIKQYLEAQGFWEWDHAPRRKGSINLSTYSAKLADAVAYWQQTHLGPDGRPLAVDGIVGDDTWWSLLHPTGKAQSSGLGKYQRLPNGLTVLRRQLLLTALGEYGVKERPMGSNRGLEVDKYLPKWWLKERNRLEKGPPWCCFFVSWVTRQVFGKYPLGRNHGSCKAAWMAAQGRGMTMVPLAPAPGDAFYMTWGPRTGHIGFVLRVSEDGKEINTVEGNCANRVKIGRRPIDYRIFGVIDFCGDGIGGFERGLIPVPEVGRDSTR